MKREYRLFIKDIFEAIEDIEKYVGEMDYSEFSRDDKTRSAVVWKIENVGEAAKHIPPEIRERYGELPWKEMSRIRDKIAHFYFGIDYKVVWDVVIKRLPAIKPQIKKMLFDLKREKPS